MLAERKHARSHCPLAEILVRQARTGITLIELLVVITVFSILMALLMPALMSARQTAQSTQCSNNLKQIGIALTSYELEWEQYPNGLTFKFALLPYLGHDEVYRSGESTASGVLGYEAIKDAVIPVYYCPSDWAPTRVAGAGRANYAGCFGPGHWQMG